MSMLNFDFKPLTQKQIDYQERRGNYWSTSMQNVVKGAEPATPSGWRDFTGLVIGIIAIVGLFFFAVAWGL